MRKKSTFTGFKTTYERLVTFTLLLPTLYSCQLVEQQFMFPNPVATDAEQITPSSFIAKWKEVVGASEYQVDVATDENFSKIFGSYNAKKAEENSLTIDNLSANISYFYRIRANVSGRISANSNNIKVTTLSLNQPVVYKPTHIKSSSFVARWKKDSNVTYLLDVATDANFDHVLDDYHQLEIKQDTAYLVQNLDINVQYFYRIQYRLSTAISAYSNVQTVTTNTLPPPTAIHATDPILFSFTANWEAQEGIELYLLDVATDADFTNFVDGYESKPITGTSHQLEDLDFRATHYYRLRSKHSDKISGYSNIIMVPPCISPTCKLVEMTRVFAVLSDKHIQYTYDTQQRLTQIAHLRSGRSYKVQILYNKDNSIQKVIQYTHNKPYQTYLYTYNSNNLLQYIQKNDMSGNFLQYWTFAYNTQGQRKSWSIYTDQARTILSQKFIYIYDSQGNVTQVKDQNNEIIREYIYDDKLNPYALFHPDLCFFIYTAEDQWAKIPATPHFEYRGFLPLHNILRENIRDSSIFLPSTYFFTYNSKGLAISQEDFYFSEYTMSGCSFEE